MENGKEFDKRNQKKPLIVCKWCELCSSIFCFVILKHGPVKQEIILWYCYETIIKITDYIPRDLKVISAEFNKLIPNTTWNKE